MPNNTKTSQKQRDAEIIDRFGDMPASRLTQSQRAQLAAARVRMREENESEEKPKRASKASSSTAPIPRMVKPETPEEVEMEKNMRRGEAAAKKQMGTLGFKKGGLVTPRGQGKVMRTRKTRTC